MRYSIESLDYLLSLFKSLLKSNDLIQNYSPKLTHFFNYISKLKPDIEKSSDYLIRIFEREITVDLIENSVGDFILNNNNANSEQIFDNYFSSISSFFRIMNLHHIIKNDELLRMLSVAQDDEASIYKIKQRAKNNLLTKHGITLNPREPDPRLEEEEFLFTLDFCNSKMEYINQINKSRKDETKPKHFPQYTSCIITKFILFTGIKFDRLVLLSYKSFDREYRTFSPILVDENGKNENNYMIHLPRDLSNQIFLYLDYRNEILKDENKKDNKSFIIDSQGRNVPNKDKNNITNFLNTIKDEYISERITDLKEEYSLENHFTVTGLSKYCVIEMIKKGINESIIKDFTGNEQKIYDYCQEEVNRLYKNNRSRYLDSKLRSMQMFDLL